MRREGYAYVDKTALMYKMVSEGSYYFLCRPRRFGKSLMYALHLIVNPGKTQPHRKFFSCKNLSHLSPAQCLSGFAG